MEDHFIMEFILHPKQTYALEEHLLRAVLNTNLSSKTTYTILTKEYFLSKFSVAFYYNKQHL